MSVQTQAILAGHLAVDSIVRRLAAEVGSTVNVRDMQRPHYKIVEFQRSDGSWTALNVFLESWAAEDYADVFKGPSTLLTADYSPENFRIVQAIACAVGGLARRTEADPWIELDQSRVITHS
jgi:hypothetical protein